MKGNHVVHDLGGRTLLAIAAFVYGKNRREQKLEVEARRAEERALAEARSKFTPLPDSLRKAIAPPQKSHRG